MKRIIFSVMAIVALLVTSCVQDAANDSLVTVGGEGTVRFSVEATNLGSRALGTYGTGVEADVLYYAVYNKNGDLLPAVSALPEGEGGSKEPVALVNGGVDNLEMKLAMGVKYDIVFWAASEALGTKYDIDWANKTMTIDPAMLNAQDELLDAFWFLAEDVEPSTNPETETVTLTRPFAQVNVATNDTQAAAAADLVVGQTQLVIDQAYTTLHLLTKEVGAPTTLTYKYATKAAGELKAGYDWLAMAYVLVGERTTADITFGYTNAAGVFVREIKVPMAPLQCNYRTNIVGSILTGGNNFNVDINPDFGGTEEIVTANVATAAELQEAIEDENTNFIILTDDIDLNDLFASLTSTRAAANPSLTIAKGKELTISLNGFTLSATETATGSYGLITNHGTLTIEGPGKITLEATNNRGWNAYSSVISNSTNGVLVVNGGTIEHRGGTDMAYGIDILTNGNLGGAHCTINGGHIKSTYRAIRQFLNSTTDQNVLEVNGGTIEGANKSIWMQDPSAKANIGTLAVAEEAQLIGNVYLYVCEGSTEWPVDVAIANAAFVGESTVVSGNVPAQYAVVNAGGIWTVADAPYYKEGNTYHINNAEGLVAVSKLEIAGGEQVVLEQDIDLTGVDFDGLNAFNSENSNTFDGKGHTVSNWTNEEGKSDFGFIKDWVGTVKNLTIVNATLKTSGRSAIVAGKIYGDIENCHVVDSTIEDSYWACGIIAGLYNAGNITGCTVTGSSVKSNGGTGAIVGVINETAGTRGVYNCSVKNTTVHNTGAYGAAYSAALVCGMINISNSTVEFNGCTLENNTKEGKYVGDLYYSVNGNQVVVDGAIVVSTTADLQAAAAAGNGVILNNDLTISAAEMLTAPYGNKMAVSHKGGVFDGNGKTISCTIGGDNYVVMTNGGTIKNLSIDNGFRGVVIMSANQTVYLDNVVSSGDGVCYALNTAEGDSTQDLVATNCTFNGWSSWSLLKSATFTNCTFGQGTYYTNVYGRLGKPYVTTLFEGCEFGSKYYIDLSALGANQVVTLKNCTVNGVKLTAENWASLVAPEDTCGDGQISIELKNGTYMTAENVADYIVIE